MNALARETERASVEGGSAGESVQRMLGLATQMEQTLAASTLSSFIEMAKVEHVMFKFGVYRSFLGIDGGHGAPGDHRSCRLGRWINSGEGRHTYARLAGFDAIDAPHAAVHRAATEAISAQATGNPADGLDALGRMEQASARLVEALDALMAAANADRGQLCRQA
jgi:hypothetical protein